MEGTWSEHIERACIPRRAGTGVVCAQPCLWPCPVFIPDLLLLPPCTAGCCCICTELLLHKQLHLVFGYQEAKEKCKLLRDESGAELGMLPFT